MKQFEVLSHTADLKIRVYGKTLSELFEHACVAMFAAVGFQSDFCTKENGTFVCSPVPQEHDIQITAMNKEMLLVDFLSEALYLCDVHNEAYVAVTMKRFSETSLHALVHGVKIKRFDLEIKAVTYHDLNFRKTADGWSVDIVFDI